MVELYTLQHIVGDIAVRCKCVVVELTEVGGALAGAWQWCVFVRERERETMYCTVVHFARLLLLLSRTT